VKTARKDGFTLIEVLVALVIVAVGMSALMGALSSSAKTVVYMQDKTFAEWVALNQIASVRIQLQRGQTPAAGKTNGDVTDFGNRNWHWAQEVVASQVPGIMRIDVKVRPKGAGSANDDDNANWYVTVSGIVGNALGAPGTGNVLWNGTGSNPLQNGSGGSNQGTSLGGGSNSNPGSSGGTGTGTGNSR
jgi:general secretion pathway protein I